jgi:hypothetical protein
MSDTPFWQTGPFWAGIIISAILSLPMGIAANACYYKLLSYLDSRRLTTQAKTRKRAQEVFTTVSDIHFKRRDGTAYLLGISTSTILFSCLGFTTLGMSIVIITLTPQADLVNSVEPPRVLIIVPLLMLSLLSLFLAAYGARRFQEITNALDRYEDYKNQFVAKWGEPQQNSE